MIYGNFIPIYKAIPGIASLIAVGLFVVLASKRWPSISLALFMAYVIRLFLILYAFFLLPDYGLHGDALEFQRLAVLWADDLPSFMYPGDYFISAVLSVFYRVFGGVSLLGQSLSFFFGTGSIILVWLLTREIWGDRVAKVAVWAAVFFPAMVIYSAFIYREAYYNFFFMLALYGMALWVRRQELSMLSLAFAGYFIATLFHGGIGIGAFIFLGLFVIQGIGIAFRYGHSISLKVFAILAVSVSVYLIHAYFIGNLSLPKVGPIANALNYDLIVNHIASLAKCESGYPDFVVPKNPEELFWKAPNLVIYYLFSPFPWDVKSDWHYVALVDGMLYFALTLLLFMNLSSVLTENGTAWLLLVLVGVILVYSFGVGNFGTAARHRTMLAYPLISLTAPQLSSLFEWLKKLFVRRSIK